MKVPTRRIPIRVPGFRFAGVACGLKVSRKRDVALILSDRPAVAAGAFTTNLVRGAPVLLSSERVRRGRAQAILVNSGNANAYTGRRGLEVAQYMCGLVRRELGVREEWVLPASTGRIGVQLPRAQVGRGVVAACRSLSADGFHYALEGMMTTDAFPKFAVEQVGVEGADVTVAGMAKGAGMIAPRMKIAVPHATLLSYVLTDARVSLPSLRQALAIGLAQSYNSIVVDGDTSTSDTLVLLANGAAGNRELTPRSRSFPAFAAAVTRVLCGLARMVVKDGEGATKLIDIHVRRARNVRDAELVADAIARSPLCKAAFYGGDPYAGRVVCAAGYSGAFFDPRRLDVYLDDVCIVRRGEEIITPALERRASAVVRKDEFALTLDLHAGSAVAHRMCSDLTVDYVRFNSDYRT